MFSILLTVAIACSTGFVTTVSTSSGLAPGYVVITNAYGRLIFGKRSVVIFIKDTTPRINTSTIPTITVYGFFTLNFDNIYFSSSSQFPTDQSVLDEVYHTPETKKRPFQVFIKISYLSVDETPR